MSLEEPSLQREQDTMSSAEVMAKTVGVRHQAFQKPCKLLFMLNDGWMMA